jgi:hypothetical protein
MPLCAACKGGREDIEEAYARGQRIVGAEYLAKPGKATAVALAPSNEVVGYDVELHLGYAAGEWLNPMGKVVRSQKAGSFSMVMSLRSDNELGWRLSRWDT